MSDHPRGMDFDDISRVVVPWIETAGILGIDLEASQRAEPRGSLRDPKDALVSMYRFMEGCFMEPGAIAIREFAQTWLKEGAEGPRRLPWPRDCRSWREPVQIP